MYLILSQVQILVNLKSCSQVVKYIEVFHASFYTILVTEYLSGGDLFERLSPKEYHLTEDKCQLFVRQIIQGIDFIHNKKIIHLDIKPFNILFENKVMTKVMESGEDDQIILYLEFRFWTQNN